MPQNNDTKKYIDMLKDRYYKRTDLVEVCIYYKTICFWNTITWKKLEQGYYFC